MKKLKLIDPDCVDCLGTGLNATSPDEQLQIKNCHCVELVDIIQHINKLRSQGALT